MWVWGEAQKLPPSASTLPEYAGQEASIVYLDTEGFESTGKADAYDDRIFALSTLISAVLVYNLPETVRESDIQKLSFAVELAEGFYADVQVSIHAGQSVVYVCLSAQPLHAALLVVYFRLTCYFGETSFTLWLATCSDVFLPLCVRRSAHA